MTELVRIGTLGAPQGLKGLIKIAVHTDQPQQRLAVGNQITTNRPGLTLTVSQYVQRQGGLYLGFEGYPDRTAVEQLRAVVLMGEPTYEEDAWYAHELIGLCAITPDGTELGEITDFREMPAQDLLTVKVASGRQALIPFVEQIVTDINPDAGTITIDAPGGLFDEDLLL